MLNPTEMNPTPILLDCDPGIDDALALLMAAASPRLQLLGVTCVAGNRPVHTTTANASALLALTGRGEVPVHAGCARPLALPEARTNRVHGEDGLGGVVLDAGPPPRPQHAVDFIARVLRDEPAGTLTLIAIGPLTNLAMVEIRDPGLLRRAKALLVMGGAAFCPGNVTPAAEFNFHADATAASVVLNAGAALTLFGLDVTSQAAMSADWIASLGRLGTRAGRAANAMLAAYAFEDPLLHDACPVAYALAPQLFDCRPLHADVERAPGPDEGRLRPDPDGRGPRLALATGVDRDGLLAAVHAEIARLA
jgi:purine nucleosidase